MSNLFEDEQFLSLDIRTQKRLARSQFQLQQAEAEINSLRYHLRQTQLELDHIQRVAEQSQTLVSAMETSKFWKLRSLWFKVKGKLKQVVLLKGGEKSDKLIVNSGFGEETPAISEALTRSEIWKIEPASYQDSVPETRINQSLTAHTKTADIIVCVHNALDDVKDCLEAVVRYTRMPYSLILVDDGSGEETREYLANFADYQGATLIRNESAKGYTFAANQGLNKSFSNYAILLNSDTVVTPEWLDRLLACAESDPQIGIVGPLSNSATWQSIPELFNAAGDDWAENPLPEGMRVAEMAQIVAEYSGRLYPRIPFLNGFCLAIKREVIEQVGYFDEVNFGAGYGEENDYCLRTRKAGWQLAIADDVYVYHHGSRSYNHERRKQLCDKANLALAEKHGVEIVSDGVEICRFDPVLQGIRSRCQVMLKRRQYIEEGKKLWEGKRVFFILPIAGVGGGGNIVLHEAEAMIKMGVDVRIVNLAPFKEGFEQGYPENKVPVIYVEKEKNIPWLFPQCDAIFATYYASVFWMNPLTPDLNIPIRGYYIQDFEPYFFPNQVTDFIEAWLSYTLYPDLVRICKTEWDREMVKDQVGVESFVGGATVNIDTYRPRCQKLPNTPKKPIRILAMIRPTSPRRAPKLTMEVLREIDRRYGDAVDIVIFGCESKELDIFDLPQDFRFQNLEILNRSQVAWIMNQIDIFIDYSVFQAQGLTAMEAMCSGCAIIVPQRGGTGEFVKHEENGLIVDSSSPEACLAALERLIVDENLRTKIQRQAIKDVCEFYPEKGAFYTLKSLFHGGEIRGDKNA
ncbi:glycosyltransferase [Ancylothrix sp. C2]|uniref:glycosyltransferase n=1 Tax=Ancylothrix sp. D3o TaxID=2953691 RepID=UPI0021BA3C4C|nr:glycosyltransferase [Ancylothrix sp. D3o]MCT7949160.1 glycosyltransferase [Ancylothrix sp. D3o]